MANKPDEPSPIDKLNELYEQVNKALSAVLAHTAACAHSSASINAYNYCLYYQQQLKLNESQPEAEISVEDIANIKTPVVPLETELRNASSKFSLLKNKISTFFQATSKLNESTPKAKKAGANKLIADYDDEDEDDEEEEEAKLNEISLEETRAKMHAKTVPPVVVLDDEDSDIDEDDNDNSILFNDLDKNCDLEIITTSELKQQLKKRNYLLPSLKALNFPLKASLNFNNLNMFIKKTPDTLVAVEKSKSALTFLGNPNRMPHGFGKRQNKLYDILYSQHQQQQK